MEGGGWKSARPSNSLAAHPTQVRICAGGGPQGPSLPRPAQVVRHAQHNQTSGKSKEVFDYASLLATVETQRRGTERAEVVCAVSDGAEWIQGFVDLQRHDAVRILDFSHAAGYVAQVGEAVLGEETAKFQTWLTTTLHALKHGSATQVVQTLQSMQQQLEGGSASSETLERVRTAVQYLDKRIAQMDYGRFQAAGYPIGSGSVESGNKVVVEARLKGAGMHWARAHVNPMVALRDVLCSERWSEDWAQIATRLRTDHLQTRQQKQRARWTQRRGAATAMSNAAPISPAPVEPPRPEPPPGTTLTRTSPSDKLKQPYRPPADHVWRHSPIGRARFKSSQRPSSTKV